MSLPSIELDLERETPAGLETEEMTLNMGPQHPSTHGVLRFVVKADGEVLTCDPASEVPLSRSYFLF